jgi:hypothetical protein
MGTVRALLSFYGVLDSATVVKKKKELKNEASGAGTGQRTRIDGMTEAGFQRVADRRVKSMYWATLEYKISPRRKKLQNTHVR